MISDYGLAQRPHRHRPDALHGARGAEAAVSRRSTFADAAKIWAKLTAIKHPMEIELIREAVRVADLGMAAAIAAVRPGISEHAVSAEAVYAMRRNGSEFEPFIPLVASGYNTSMFERVATEKIIQSGEMVILDIGAVVKGYTGDLGRTVDLRRADRRAEGDLQGDAPRAAGGQEGHQARRHLPRDRRARARGDRGRRLGQVSLHAATPATSSATACTASRWCTTTSTSRSSRTW